MDPDVTKTLRDLEESHLIPDVRADRDRLASLLHDQFLEIGASGKLWSREDVLQHIVHEPTTTRSLDEFECRLLNDQTALTTYRVTRTNPNDGSKTLSRRSSVWLRESDTWKLRFHQGTPL